MTIATGLAVVFSHDYTFTPDGLAALPGPVLLRLQDSIVITRRETDEAVACVKRANVADDGVALDEAIEVCEFVAAAVRAAGDAVRVELERRLGSLQVKADTGVPWA